MGRKTCSSTKIAELEHENIVCSVVVHDICARARTKMIAYYV